MAARITIKAIHAEDPDTLFTEAIRFGELREAMRGLATYEGLDDDIEVVKGETYTVDVTLWGFLKNSGHVMHVEDLDLGRRLIQSREHNAAIKRWDHRLTVDKHVQGALWTDDIIMDAGWRTFGAARFCAYVYGYRHRRRRALSTKTTIRKAEAQQ